MRPVSVARHTAGVAIEGLLVLATIAALIVAMTVVASGQPGGAGNALAARGGGGVLTIADGSVRVDHGGDGQSGDRRPGSWPSASRTTSSCYRQYVKVDPTTHQATAHARANAQLDERSGLVQGRGRDLVQGHAVARPRRDDLQRRRLNPKAPRDTEAAGRPAASSCSTADILTVHEQATTDGRPDQPRPLFRANIPEPLPPQPAGEAAAAVVPARVRFAAVLVPAAVALVLYLVTLAPTVATGDSGELAAVAATLGLAHPPGYPTFTLLGHLFTWLPFGDPAYRVNLLSAVLDMVAVGVAAFGTARLVEVTRGSAAIRAALADARMRGPRGRQRDPGHAAGPVGPDWLPWRPARSAA